VTSQALTSLHNLIKQDDLADDGISKQRQKRHLHKFLMLLKHALPNVPSFGIKNPFFSNVNNEAKGRRSIYLVVTSIGTSPDMVRDQTATFAIQHNKPRKGLAI
jgi:hypothetical protein